MSAGADPAELIYREIEAVLDRHRQGRISEAVIAAAIERVARSSAAIGALAVKYAGDRLKAAQSQDERAPWDRA